MNKVIEIFGSPAERTTPGSWWLVVEVASVAWLAVRVGWHQWMQAGIAKVWGAENQRSFTTRSRCRRVRWNTAPLPTAGGAP